MRQRRACVVRARGIAASATLLVAACSRSAPTDLDAWASAVPTADTTRAAALYTRTRALPGEPEPVSCAVCHGAEGQGNYGTENPKHIAPHLAGLNATYVGEQLRAYGTGTRHFALMQAMAAPLSAQDVADLAVYIHGLKGAGLGHAPVTDAATAQRGYDIWHQGKPGKLASCASCHGADGAGKVLRSPEIAGQPLPYLIAQLKTMRAKGRTGTAAADTMTAEAQGMSDREIEDVAAYISGIEPVSERPAR